jgi:hypothetical protein
MSVGLVLFSGEIGVKGVRRIDEFQTEVDSWQMGDFMKSHSETSGTAWLLGVPSWTAP